MHNLIFVFVQPSSLAFPLLSLGNLAILTILTFDRHAHLAKVGLHRDASSSTALLYLCAALGLPEGGDAFAGKGGSGKGGASSGGRVRARSPGKRRGGNAATVQVAGEDRGTGLHLLSVLAITSVKLSSASWVLLGRVMEVIFTISCSIPFHLYI